MEMLYLLGDDDFLDMYHDERAKSFRGLVQDIFTYLDKDAHRVKGVHREGAFLARLRASHSRVQRMLKKASGPMIIGRLTALMPNGGLGHPNVNRLLLTAGVDHRLNRVPMALMMERIDHGVYQRAENNSL